MRRFLSFILSVIMISSCLVIPSAAQSTPSYTLGTRIELNNLGDDAGHGNHQTRTVHTSHGDYAAYITSTYTDNKYRTVNKWSLIKIDPATKKSSVIFTGEKYYDSSQVSLIVDKDENVWAITSTSDSFRNSSYEAIDARAHRLDAKTGEVTSYTTIIGGGTHDGYGYATCFYDKNYDRIIVMHAGGDYVKGSTSGASFNWTIFDLKTNKWQTRVRYVKIDARHCYMYGYADGKGGLILLAQRDIKAESLGYPEIGSDQGLTSADRQYMSQNGITRWAANYCWDQLDLYYFPKITESKYTKYSVCEADYSQVKGTQDQRYTLSYRLSNYYCAAQNNNGGDVLLTETSNGRLLLHITYNKALIQAAMDRSKASESKWYHQVWDVTDGADYCAKLYDGVLVDEMAGESGYGFRLYEDTEGNVNIVSSHNGALTIYRAEYNGKGGYNYHKVGTTQTLKGAGNLLNISSHRGGSITDNKINILYTSSGKYMFYQVTLSPAKYDPIPCSHSYEPSPELSTPATCTDTGSNSYCCKWCLNIYSEVSAPLDHDKIVQETPPTCTAKGKTVVTCTRCDYSVTTTSEMLPHDTETATVSPTCTEDGYTAVSCKNCDFAEITVTKANGHRFNNGTCTLCGEEDPYLNSITGDINGDGKVNSMDSNSLKRIMSGTLKATEAQAKIADINGDGNVNSLDANILSRYNAGLLSQPQ